MPKVPERETRYLNLILTPIRICASYKPKLGLGNKAGLSLKDFQKIYRGDPFYTWFGLDNPLMYAAHKAAGGMTSVYRQIGIGCEHLFRAIIQDELGLTEEQSRWSYSVTTANKMRTLSLDARIHLPAIKNARKKRRVAGWIRDVATSMNIEPRVIETLHGSVFEVRQGYKSKDSKRQNADIANAATAYTQAYLPCVVLMSSQMDSDIMTRYQHEKWAILTGPPVEATPLKSTYSFLKDIVGYDLAAFFESHSRKIQREVAKVLETLLKAE